MGQTRINSVAILNIERKYVNMSLGKNVDKIISFKLYVILLTVIYKKTF